MREQKRIPAAFLDRDGTLIIDRDYPGDPDGVALLPGAVDAVRRLNAAGVPVIIVTNQSGIARGLITHEDYARVAARVDELLRAGGARVEAAYYCPHLPEISGACDCRKPATGMYERAAAEHGLDPARSLFAGDRWRDVEPGLRLGGRAMLVPSPSTPADDVARARAEAEVAGSIGEAVDRFLAEGAAPLTRRGRDG